VCAFRHDVETRHDWQRMEIAPVALKSRADHTDRIWASQDSVLLGYLVERY
jgi:hypothetical protein